MYIKKAFDILNSSINSAIFIDEKAKSFFSGSPVNTQIPEETLSESLYNTFKKNGKSLAVHRFEITDFDNPEILNYLFNSRDLILLDWELADVAGQEYSLKLLNRAIETPYVNFCCVYSSSNNFNNISYFLDAYFCGLTINDFELIKDSYSHITVDEIQNIFGKDDIEISCFFKDNQIEVLSFPIEKLRQKSNAMLLRIIYISLTIENFFIPKEPVEYEIINNGNDSFIINNTFVFTLKKEINNDNDYDKLIKRISEAVIKNGASFFQLLGLEMQSIFNSNEKFIDESLLKSSTEALFQFRNHIKDDKVFGAIIKNLLIEQASLKLRTAKLKLLETDFLDKKTEELKDKIPSDDDLFQLNVFYNSVSVKGIRPEDFPILNFGDIFIGDKKDYYLCITALCDCYYPNKISGNFYFVEGTEFEDIGLANELSDTAFLSFLPNGKSVYWGVLDKPQNMNKINNLVLSESKDDINKLNNDIELLKNRIRKLTENQDALKSSLYKPFYIKPKIFNVENNKLIDNKIRIWDITNKFTNEKFDQNLNYFNVEYITTLRRDYTQRIANHAFGHPARVGVDFVKKK